MPIIVQEDKWEQTEFTISVYLPLKTVAKKDVDIFSTPKYIKISYPPNIFEKYLYSEIDDTKSKAEITDQQIILILQKCTPGYWKSVAHTSSGNCETMRQVRSEALEFAASRSLEEQKSQKARKTEQHGFVVSEHMDRESKFKRQIEAHLNKEKSELLQSFSLKNDLLNDNQQDFENRKSTEQQLETAENSLTNLLEQVAAVDRKYTRIHPKHDKKSEARKSIGIRPSATITFSTTCRVFPTPQRESQVEIEQEWLRKQASYRKILGADGSLLSLNPEERDPTWLKNKGDEFYDVSDFLSSLSCYSHALSLGCCMPEMYYNRALCHLRLGNLHKVLEDMEQALQHWGPPVVDNQVQRRKANYVRGIVFCKLTLFAESLVELTEVLRGDPQHVEVTKLYSFVKSQTMVSVTEDSEATKWMVSPNVLERC